jgi:hypothetical protein
MLKNLDVGDTFPDFELPDEKGVLHKLSDIQGGNPLVVQLGRGEHCPRELKMTTGGHWTFLADVDLKVRSELGIEEYVDDHHTASVPHTVILGPNLEIFKIYCGFWFFGRPSIYDLWTDMRELRMKFDYNFDPLAPGVREQWEAKHPERRMPVAMRPPAKRRSTARPRRTRVAAKR